MGEHFFLYEAPSAIARCKTKRVSELTFIKETSRLASCFGTLKKQSFWRIRDI